MPDLATEEKAAAEAYGAEIARIGRELAPRIRRYTALHTQALERGDDDALRAARMAECRSWRRLLDALPEEPSPIFADTHARLLRWHGAIANVGDEIAAAVAANHSRALNAAHVKLSEAAALGIEVMRAAIQDVERVRRQ